MGLFGSRKPNPVAELLKKDQWSVAQLDGESGPAILRFRTPVLSGPAVAGYPRVLKILWGYAPEHSGALPDRDQSNQMEVFEDRFCEAVERDALAALTAVLTFDGARQWVFYTRDVAECGARLHAMPQEVDPYPIELTTEEDPEWSYLRNEILKRVDYPK